MGKLMGFWRALRQLTGDDAYDRYLQHHAEHHPDQLPVTRRQFFKQRQDEKWQGIKRCC